MQPFIVLAIVFVLYYLATRVKKDRDLLKTISDLALLDIPIEAFVELTPPERLRFVEVKAKECNTRFLHRNRAALQAFMHTSAFEALGSDMQKAVQRRIRALDVEYERECAKGGSIRLRDWRPLGDLLIPRALDADTAIIQLRSAIRALSNERDHLQNITERCGLS